MDWLKQLSTTEGEALAAQQAAHEPNGGIVPTLALQKHTQITPFIAKEALQRSGLGIHDIDVIAVTREPGIGEYTLLVIVHDINAYTQLDSITDDSVGDAFDTV
ncbi:Mitochondrial tRNAs modification protein, partial [Dimargaris xerosporica]